MPDLTVTAPEGAHFEFEEVRTAKGAESLGEVPILIWDNASAAIAQYGEEGVRDILDGTSLRVSFQSIARRMRAAGKTDDEIATAQVAFRPGKRAVGASTPESRAAKSARSAVAKSGNADLITALLDKVAKGELSNEDLEALVA